MIKNYFIFGISICFISWLVAIFLHGMVVKTRHYHKVTQLQFIKSDRLVAILGLRYFKWIVVNTPFKFFNQNISLKNKKRSLQEIRNEMTHAEISHLIAFLLVMLVAVYKTITHTFLFGVIIMLCNIILNLYPSLLQQEHKRRIDKILRFKKVTNES